MKTSIRLRCAFATALFAASTCGQTAPLYGLTDITSGHAVAINARGDVAGQTRGAEGASFLYRDGVIVDIQPALQAIGFDPCCSQMGGLNDAGEVVGWASIYQSGTYLGYYYFAGAARIIAPAEKDSVVVSDINNAGLMSGFDNSTAFILDGESATYFQMQTAWAINESGLVVGSVWTPVDDSYALHAALYDGSQVIDITPSLHHQSEALAINDAGQVVGYTGSEAFLYSDGTVTPLPSLPGSYSCHASGINGPGQIVGNCYTVERYEGFVYLGDTMHNLNDLVALPPGWYLSNASGINDAGQIAATLINENNQHESRAVLLSPIPEPATTALIAVGAFIVAGYAGSRRQQKFPSSRLAARYRRA